jgi:hypothetical protein
MTKTVKFLGEEVVINKLTVAQVMAIQELTQNAGEKDNSMEVLSFVITNAVEGADSLSSDEIEQFPLEELSRLSSDILEFSGLGNVKK